jgi:hypothetical protein
LVSFYNPGLVGPEDIRETVNAAWNEDVELNVSGVGYSGSFSDSHGSFTFHLVLDGGSWKGYVDDNEDWPVFRERWLIRDEGPVKRAEGLYPESVTLLLVNDTDGEEPDNTFEVTATWGCTGYAWFDWMNPDDHEEGWYGSVRLGLYCSGDSGGSYGWWIGYENVGELMAEWYKEGGRTPEGTYSRVYNLEGVFEGESTITV